jgi:HMG box factor
MGSGVEVKSSALIVVRVGTGGGDRVGGGLDEKMERRLGFEVVEWVRAAAWEGRREGLGLEY